MAKFDPPNVPLIQAHMVGSKQRPSAICIDLSETTSDTGAAYGVALRLHKTNSPAKSYHFVVDETRAYRGLRENFASYDNPYRSISVLICAQPKEHEALWEEPGSRAALNYAASIVADLILAYRIPLRYLEGEDRDRWNKRRWRRRGGIIIKARGAFPRQVFMNDVKTAIEIKTKKG